MHYRTNLELIIGEECWKGRHLNDLMRECCLQSTITHNMCIKYVHNYVGVGADIHTSFDFLKTMQHIQYK